MTAQTSSPHTVAVPEPDTAPQRSAGDFAPQLGVHPVAALTLGRQTFNDSDKDNYFES